MYMYIAISQISFPLKQAKNTREEQEEPKTP